MNNRKSSRVEGVRQISVPNTSLYTCRCSRIRPECAYVHAHARNTYMYMYNMYIIYVQAIYKYTWREFLHRVLSFADYQLCGNEHVGDIIVDTSARTFLLLFDSILSNRILFLKQKCVANQVESVEESFAILSLYDFNKLDGTYYRNYYSNFCTICFNCSYLIIAYIISSTRKKYVV